MVNAAWGLQQVRCPIGSWLGGRLSELLPSRKGEHQAWMAAIVIIIHPLAVGFTNIATAEPAAPMAEVRARLARMPAWPELFRTGGGFFE
jgi:hypothetical protein